MTVYVDDMYLYKMGEYRNMKMSHMISDESTEELLEMIDKIDVDRKWIQKAGTSEEHFDIAMSKRVLAIKNGAVPISMQELVKIKRRKRNKNDNTNK